MAVDIQPPFFISPGSMYHQSYLQSAKEILKLYNGEFPFASWLKQYFKQHKKFGSRDRKIVADLCYSYFRIGALLSGITLEERLLTAQFLCHSDSVFIHELKPEWNNYISVPLHKKLRFLNVEATFLFPLTDELSPEIDKDAFARSHLVQPDLFLRIRPGKKQQVIKKLQEAPIHFLIEADIVRLPNNTKLDDVLAIDTEVVVQDKNSQQVLDPLKNFWQKTFFTAWDCCAASGGKTILLHDNFPNAALAVSDIRETIIRNLRNRFRRAGINHYDAFVTDVSSLQFRLNRKFDLIICDAPCSGSGTWGRTPEQLSFFQKEKIDHYANLQKAIAVNAAKQLQEGGCFLYITCSVFKKENEDVVAHLLEQTKLRLIQQQYFKGYEEKADTLFAALFVL